MGKLCVLFPHTLGEKNKNDRKFIATTLKKQRNDSFLGNIITGDEKWVLYDNVNHKKQEIENDEPQQFISKIDLHGKKLCRLYMVGLQSNNSFRFFICNQILNADLFYQRLQNVYENLQRKRSELLYRKKKTLYFSLIRQNQIQQELWKRKLRTWACLFFTI